MSEIENAQDKSLTRSKKEGFLQAVEQKTTNEIHKRLLSACRGKDASKEIEGELNKIVTEILHET